MRVGEEEFFYISCQGPLPTTVSAFWQMIWESKSNVVAMMTKEVERGRVKCHRYWPEKPGIPQDTGKYLLHLENQQNLEYFQIKIIRMVEREVRTFKFQKLTQNSCQPLKGNILDFYFLSVVLKPGSEGKPWKREVNVSEKICMDATWMHGSSFIKYG